MNQNRRSTSNDLRDTFSDLDKKSIPVSATADDVILYKTGIFDQIDSAVSSSKTVSTWLLIGGAGLIAKAVFVPVSAPVDLPAGAVAIQSSNVISILNTTADIGN